MDKTSQVTVQDDNPLYCMSASESSGYKWQTNINNDDRKTRVDISWTDHFVSEVHEAGSFLNLVGPYQPRLTDGFICVVLLINVIYKQTIKIYIVDVFK
jgi:hypothetical protein